MRRESRLKYILILVFAICRIGQMNAQSNEVNHIEASPLNPTTNDLITITLYGMVELENSCAYLDYSGPALNGNEFTIDLFVNTTGGPTCFFLYSVENFTQEIYVAPADPGDYCVTVTGFPTAAAVTDDMRCFTVASPCSNLGLGVSTQPASCGLANGSATALGSGGQAPYEYQWSNGSTGSAASELSSGGYSVTAIDNTGCITEASFIIAEEACSCRAQDSLALVAFYNATDGPNWLTGWNLQQPMDSWFGIMLNNDGCVQSIYLEENGLSGPLPDAIGSLSSLEELQLQRNALSGPLPAALGSLGALQRLLLYGNNFDGSIPDALGALGQLQMLELSDNQLSGSLPAGLGQLANLYYLSVMNNNLSGAIPSALYGLSQLRVLNLSGNQLAGELSAQVGNLSQLNILALRDNQFSGPLPASLGGLDNLSTLDLRQNGFSGALPPEVGDMALLSVLLLDHNDLSGGLPSSLATPFFHTLSLGNNDFTGALPALNTQGLVYLQVDSNRLREVPVLNLAPENGIILPVIYHPGEDPVQFLIDAPEVMTGQSAYFLEGNGLTFEDILPILAQDGLAVRYTPQDSIFNTNNAGTLVGANFGLNIGFDAGISGNVYYWYKNGQLWNTITGSNVLAFSNIQLSDAGEYYVRVENPNAPGLSIHWEQLVLSVSPGAPSCSRPADSLALAGIYNVLTPDSVGGPWANPWNLQQPMDTWHGVTLNAQGCVEALDLPNNSMGHFIPISIDQLSALKRLDLSGNNFTGCVGGSRDFWCNQLEMADISGNVFLLYDNIDELCNPTWDFVCSPTSFDGFVGPDDLNAILNDPERFATTVSPAYHFYNCDGTNTITDDVTPGGCGPTVITRTYTLRDDNGQFRDACSQTISVSRPGFSHVVPPAPFTIGCGQGYPADGGGNPSPALTGYPTVQTYFSEYGLAPSYDNLQASYTDDPPVLQGAETLIIRRWTVANSCAPVNPMMFTQNIVIDNCLNDDCGTLIGLGTVPVCNQETYTNFSATASNIGAGNHPDCFYGSSAERDVWFSFTTSDTLIDISVFLDGVGAGPNGAITNPQMALYRGGCEGGLAYLGFCINSPDGANQAQLDLAGLTPSTTYFLRINDYSLTADPNWGDFTLCITPYSPVSNCRMQDSLALVELYNATHENGDWVNEWDLSQPMDTWHGVVLNVDGCVDRLNLLFNNLAGELPDLNLPNLTDFSCRGNLLTGSIPDFSNLPNLLSLDCNNNEFTGSIPDFMSLPNLLYFSCSYNQLTGSIPDFANLPNLEDFFCNTAGQLDGGIPDFTNLPNLRRLWCPGNGLSGGIPDFTNLPSLETFSCSINQLSGSIPDFSNLPNLGLFNCFNNQLSGSIPDFSNTPNLSSLGCHFNQLSGQAPDFTDNCPNLQSFNFQNNQFTFEGIFDGLLSPGSVNYAPQDSIFTDTLIQRNAGESLIVDLGIDDTVTTNVYYWFKDGVLWNTINGSNELSFPSLQASDAGVYNVQVQNPNAPELTLLGRRITIQVGCVSNSTTLSPVLCPGEGLEVNGTVYDQSNPSGTEVLPATNGCDSVVNINLSFYAPIVVDYAPMLCPGESLEVNGAVYDENNPAGVEVFTAANGCDSTVNISLSFSAAISNDITATICQGESYLLGGVSYTQSGDYTAILTAASGCDSIVNLSLSVDMVATPAGPTSYTSCAGGPLPALNVNVGAGEAADWYGAPQGGSPLAQGAVSFTPPAPGTYYAEARNPASGCVSPQRLAIVVATVLPPISTVSRPTCHPSEVGRDTLFLQTPEGCDSLVAIDYFFEALDTTFLSGTTCQWEEVGAQSLVLISQEGCDSIVYLALELEDRLIRRFFATTCDPGMLGADTIFLQTPAGCDSLIILERTLAPPIIQLADTVICEGQSIAFNGQMLDTEGTYADTLVTPAGCDSILQLNLSVEEPFETVLEDLICEGGVYTYGDNTYTAPGQYRQYLQSSEGCDSLVTLVLEAISPPPLLARDDEATFPSGRTLVNLGLTANDELPANAEWELEIVEAPRNGIFTINGPGQGSYELFDPEFLGGDSLTYRLCATVCSDTCSEATARLFFRKDCQEAIEANLPTGFTPDGDGVNDLFDPLAAVADGGCLQNPQNARLVIINRWGEVAFEADPYQPWDGRHQSTGSLVPQGVYFFVLEFEFSEKQWMRRPVHVLLR